MNSSFKKILVLIDSSQASIHSANEAAELASKFGSELHLLHIISVGSFVQSLLNHENRNSSNKLDLNKMKADILNKHNIVIKTIETKGEVSVVVSSLVKKEHFDLVVVTGKKQSTIEELISKSLAENITHNISCEVLCIYPETNFNTIKQMVIPVGKIIPKRKIRIAFELAKKFASNIHLISLAKNTAGLRSEELKALMDAYRYLKEMTNLPVQCSSVIGNNIAEASLSYAKKIKADLILVNPATESRLKDFIISSRGRDIINHSPVPVLSVYSA